MKGKKGGAIIAILFIVGIFLATVTFLFLMPIVGQVIDVALNQSAVASSPVAVTTIHRLEAYWYIFPILLLIILTIWAISRAMYQEPLSGY